MLISQHNGLALGGDTEVDVLQNLACTIGPRVAGVAAGRATPPSMGAFSTYGSQMACGGYDQQQEQHMPTTTTTREFGQALEPMTATAPAPTPTTTTSPLSKLVAIRQMTMAPITKAMTTAVEPASAPQPELTPMGPASMTYPPGSITAFVAETNMWRVAVPATSLGLGIFGATASFTEVAPTQAPPAGATQVSLTQFEKQTGTLPLYKKWQFWAAVAGGVVVVGGGALFIARRKRAA